MLDTVSILALNKSLDSEIAKYSSKFLTLSTLKQESAIIEREGENKTLLRGQCMDCIFLRFVANRCHEEENETGGPGEGLVVELLAGPLSDGYPTDTFRRSKHFAPPNTRAEARRSQLLCLWIPHSLRAPGKAWRELVTELGQMLPSKPFELRIIAVAFRRKNTRVPRMGLSSRGPGSRSVELILSRGTALVSMNTPTDRILRFASLSWLGS